jgi:NADH dehydrogenase [ubiquinone] 1 alpha subcomplex assembly factor 7
MSTPSPPLAAIRAAIADHGPIGFDEYMELALYGPGGYYERPPVGPEGDYVTSPHVHPVFGELLAEALRELWTHLGEPDPFALVELGAGDGTLARQLLRHLEDLPLGYTAVERSSGARKMLRAIEGLVVSRSIPGDPSVVLGHELLDNLPFKIFRGTAEMRVATDGDLLILARAPIAPGVDLHGRAAGEGEERVLPTGALALVRELGARLRHGYALFVDYGTERGAGGPVHGYRGHRVIEDVLDRPGSADITAGVDFGVLSREALEFGLESFRLRTQSQALASLGYEDWMRAELASQGALLNEDRGMDAVRTWAGRSSATILVNPEQLGRLRWWGVASRGLPRPTFLTDRTQGT